MDRTHLLIPSLESSVMGLAFLKEILVDKMLTAS
jgi:hypothetical protein